MDARSGELDTATWQRIFSEAAELGIIHIHLSGGEPASRRDLVDIVAHCAKVGLYTNLITSGIGLSEERIAELSRFRSGKEQDATLQALADGRNDYNSSDHAPPTRAQKARTPAQSPASPRKLNGLERPLFEVADIFRRYGAGYRMRHLLPLLQLRVMRAIEICRTLMSSIVFCLCYTLA